MSDRIHFVNHYNDLSTDQGFQFEFLCDRCGTGVRTRFKPNKLAQVNNGLHALGSLFGGVFNSAADLGERARSSAWEKAHDDAFSSSVEELKEEFQQCPRCQTWVCRNGCWSTKKGLCKNCAPDLGVEMAAAQASKSVEEVWAHAKMAEEDKHLTEADWREGIRATCPECEAPLAANAKFCPECGANLKDKTKCTKCGAKLTPGVKFCPECGEKVIE